ncbi:recombinase family protein [Brevundimonas sp. NPDC090276]|uniref:recombinase family protein n=1 Tax=Brevundimonas sp. NPDC090276 TaxID=3363956 RepID=UPI00383B2639
MGHRTDEGRRFTVGKVHRMLHTEAYTGTFLYGRFDTASRRELPESEWISISIPPLISKEQYARVQRLLWERRPDVTAPRLTNSALVLGGIARCKACGATMGLQTGKSHTGAIHRYYTCSAHLKSGACKGNAPVRVPASKLEAAVLKVLTENVFVPAFVQTVVKRVVDGRARGKANAIGSVDRLKTELTRVEKALRAMMDAITGGLIGDDDIFRQKYGALQEERKEAQRLIAMHERNLARSLEPLTDVQATKAAGRLKEMLLAAAPKLQRRFVRALVGEVVVGPNMATVIGPQSALAEVASNTPPAEAAQASYPQVRGSVLGWCG